MKKMSRIACAVLTALLFSGVANATIISEFVADGVNAPGISGFSLVDQVGPQSRYHTNETVSGTSYDAWAMNSAAGGKGSYYESTSAGIQDMKDNGYTLTYIARTETAEALGHHRLLWYDGGREYRVYFQQNDTDKLVALDTPGTGSTTILDMDLSANYHTFQVTYAPETPGVYSGNDMLSFYVDGSLVFTSTRAAANYVDSDRTSVRVEFGDASTAAAGLFHANTIRLEDGINVVAVPDSFIDFTANGTDNGPIDQGFEWLSTTNDPSMYYTNETVGGTAYDAWVIDSVAGDNGYYRNEANEHESTLQEDGYTVTYVARIASASAHASTLTFRDKTSIFKLFFVDDGPEGATDGIYFDGPIANILAVAMDLSDDYHTYQLVCEPEVQGSFSDTDTLTLYVDGVAVHSDTRINLQNAVQTYVVRAEIWDNSTVGSSLFMVNKLTVETGVNPMDGPAIQLGSNRELFVDYYLIDTNATSGVDLVLQTPVDEGQVIAFADEAWESAYSGYCTVLKDNGLYKLYYRSSGHACYAYSSDGANWTKPELGLFYIGGTWSNNVVMPSVKAFSPFIDTKPGVPESERYKAVNPAYYDESGGYLDGYVSSNGVDWARINGANPSNSVLFFPEFSMDSQNVAFYSEAEQQYVCYFRDWDGSKRRIRRATASVFSNFTDQAMMEYAYPGPAGSVPPEHHYINGTFPYFRAPHTYIALAARLVVGESGQIGSWAEAQSLGVTSESYYNDNANNDSYAIFMSTRPGELTYDRPFTNQYIDASATVGKQMARSDYPALNAVRTGADEMSFYVTHNYASTLNHLRRYSLRLDGFVALSETNGVAGEMVTKPFTFEGDRLRLNYLARAGGRVKVEIQDANGDAISGYALADAVALTGDDTDADASWTGGTDVGPLEGQTVKLRFEIDDADLFAFRFIPAYVAAVADFTASSENTVKMTIDISVVSPGDYYLQSTTNLVDGTWGDAPHSADGVSPFVVTNVTDYFTAEGRNAVIYLETDASAEFFKIRVK